MIQYDPNAMHPNHNDHAKGVGAVAGLEAGGRLADPKPRPAPIAPSQLDHADQAIDLVACDLQRIRALYHTQRHTFIPGERMAQILPSFGATYEDIALLHALGDGLLGDPTLPFRKSRNGRFCMDFENERIFRLEFQPFVLTSDEDFVRHDSGVVRHFRGIQDGLQTNSAFQALMRFQAFIIHGGQVEQRPNLDYNSKKLVSTVFHLRTITTPKLLGEPAAEGVHSDGVDHTMTTLLGATNMRGDSAVSDLHSMEQNNGLPWHRADPNHLVGSFQHRHPLDTLLIIDHELKHTVSPVHPDQPGAPATRDMLIFFTRHPAAKGHPSHTYDSLNPHPEIPLDVPMHPGA